MDARTSSLIPPARPAGLGDPLLDAYLEFVTARSRPNTVLATRFDLKVFFSVVDKPVDAVTSRDVLGFITAQRSGVDKLRLNREHRRLLGNGYCTRPAVMDCEYETICESCTFFQTTIEFRPTLLGPSPVWWTPELAASRIGGQYSGINTP